MLAKLLHIVHSYEIEPPYVGLCTMWLEVWDMSNPFVSLVFYSSKIDHGVDATGV